MLVLPGEYVAESEEYIPGYGVYEDDALYSEVVGDLLLDSKEHMARVKARTRVPKLQSRGTIAIGQVVRVQDQMAMIDLATVNSRSFSLVPRGVPGILPVAAVSRQYVEDLRDKIRVGDIVRVKIESVTPYSVRLRMDERNLGVIKAYCTRCRTLLVKKGRMLICPNCGHKENRKLAEDYGKWKIM